MYGVCIVGYSNVYMLLLYISLLKYMDFMMHTSYNTVDSYKILLSSSQFMSEK